MRNGELFPLEELATSNSKKNCCHFTFTKPHNLLITIKSKNVWRNIHDDKFTNINFPTYHFTVTRLIMMRSTGRSCEAPSRMASRTCVEALCRRSRNFDVNAESVMRATMVSCSLLSGSVESTNSCHSS